MRKLFVPALALCLATLPASAQTYGDLYEEGALDGVSNLEKHIGRLLVDNGVSVTCIAKLSWNDVAMMNGVLNTSNSAHTKKNRVAAILRRSCDGSEGL